MILLASRSPQRRALLASLDVPFRIVVADVREGPDASVNARAKALAVAERSGIPEGGAVLGADTEVILDGRALGKPADAADARRMLAALAGREHEVLTAVALVTGGGVREERVSAVVRMRPAVPARLDWYLSRGEWRDRAGGYAIQGAGAALVAAVEGDPATVIGLPVGTVAEMLADAGCGAW